MNKRIVVKEAGYTLIEGIIALSLTAIGMLLVVSFLGLDLEADHRSKIVLREAVEINSLRDGLKKELKQQPVISDEIISGFLEKEFSDYRFVKFTPTAEQNCWQIEIEHKLNLEDHFYIIFYGGKESGG